MWQIDARQFVTKGIYSFRTLYQKEYNRTISILVS